MLITMVERGTNSGFIAVATFQIPYYLEYPYTVRVSPVLLIIYILWILQMYLQSINHSSF